MQYKGFIMNNKSLQNNQFSDAEIGMLEMFEDVFYKTTGAKLKESGKEKIVRAINHFGVREVLIALEISLDQYYDGSKESVREVFDKISGILVVRAKKDRHSYTKYYIRKVLKDTFGAFNDNNYFYLIDKALTNTTSDEIADFIKEECLECGSFQELIDYLEEVAFFVLKKGGR